MSEYDAVKARIERIHKALKSALKVEALSCTFDGSGNLLTVEGVSYKDSDGVWQFRSLTDAEKKLIDSLMATQSSSTS